MGRAAVTGIGIGNICMSPLIALLNDEFSYFGTMVITGALLLNNDVGGALYRTPPATIWICQETLVTQESAAETETDLSQNVTSAIIFARDHNTFCVVYDSRKM